MTKNPGEEKHYSNNLGSIFPMFDLWMIEFVIFELKIKFSAIFFLGVLFSGPNSEI